MDPEEHRAEVEAWRAGRYERLRADLGWLTIAGLDWLRPGVNRVGSDPSCDIVLPGGPPTAGELTLEDGSVTADGAFTHDGEPVRGLRLVDDRGPDMTLLELAELRLCIIERGGRLALRTWNLASPARSSFTGIDHWPVDPRWRIEARFGPDPRELDVPDVLGGTDPQTSPGEVAFELQGRTHRLQALSGGDGGELWLVFGDATNGVETYGGGRFLYTEAPTPDGRVVVDFNRAYNPPCVFTPHATCPLPWAENRLPARIEAGERAYDGAH